MRTRTPNPSIKELRMKATSFMRSFANELKAKDIKIDAEFMDKLSMNAKYYSLLSEAVNAEKIEELIELSAFRVVMSSLDDLYKKVLSRKVETDIKTIDDLLVRYDEILKEGLTVDADTDLPLEIDGLLAEIACKYDDTVSSATTVRNVNLVMKFTSSVFNSFAHSKDTIEDTSNWFVKKSANLVNKIADVIDQEESPERSSADIMLRMKESLRKRNLKKKKKKSKAPDLKVAKEE